MEKVQPYLKSLGKGSENVSIPAAAPNDRRDSAEFKAGCQPDKGTTPAFKPETPDLKMGLPKA